MPAPFFSHSDEFNTWGWARSKTKQKPSSRSFRSLKTQYSTPQSWAHLALPAQSQVHCDKGSQSSGTGWRWARKRCSGLGSRQGQSMYCKTHQREGKRVRQRETGKALQKDQCTSTPGPGSTIISDSLSLSLLILWNFPASISPSFTRDHSTA